MQLSNRRTLGRSGLPVSGFALGTMTFGSAGWGSPDDVSEAIFNAYVDAGGNFVDTADVCEARSCSDVSSRHASCAKPSVVEAILELTSNQLAHLQQMDSFEPGFYELFHQQKLLRWC